MGDLERIVAERIAAQAAALAREMCDLQGWRGKGQITVKETADVLGYSQDTVRAMIDRGDLRATTTGPGGAVRVTVASIRLFLGEV